MFIDRSDCRNSRVGLATCSNCYNCLQNLKMIRKSYFDANIFFAAGHDHFYRRVLLARAMMLHNSSHAVLEKFEQHMEQMARYVNYSNLTTSFQLWKEKKKIIITNSKTRNFFIEGFSFYRSFYVTVYIKNTIIIATLKASHYYMSFVYLAYIIFDRKVQRFHRGNSINYTYYKKLIMLYYLLAIL